MADVYPVQASRADASPHSDRPYVDWGAIVAGALLAAAISMIFVTFGSAVGLSLSGPYQGEGMSARALLIAVAIYGVWVTASSFIAGGYLAGRLRRGAGNSSVHEGHVRDGAHGLVVWALGALFASYLAASAASGVAKSGVELASSGVSVAAGAMSGSADASGYLADTLMRGATAGSGAAAPDFSRQEIADILGHSTATGGVSADDKAYLSRLVAARTGLAPAEADKRVDAIIAQGRTASEAAKKTAEQARRAGILLAFLTAASLAIGAAGAWWGASLGGRHRDEGTDLAHYVRW